MFIRLMPLLIFAPLLGVVAAGCAKQPARTVAPATASAAPGTGAVGGAGTVQGMGTEGMGAIQGTGTPQGTATSQETGTSQRTGRALGAEAPKPATPLAAARVTPGPAGTSGASGLSPEEFTPSRALRDIHFEFDKYEIRAAAARILDGHSNWLRDNYRSVILIEGHADERGTNEYNLALGDRRAKAAMNYLIARGVAASQINVITYGEERPLCVQATEACWFQNRRAHFLVKRQ